MLLNLGCIVEGDGDKAAVPKLLRRIQCELAPDLDLRIRQPWRIGRYKLVSHPESIRDAKNALSHNMAGSRAYSPTADQTALTAVFDMQSARRGADSFDKCWREVERLFAEASP